MSKPAGDAQTRYVLQKRYQAVGCFVCKSREHTYQACPNRPCYLCRKKGHLSHACPFRLKPGAHATALRTLLESRGKRSRVGPWLRARELQSSPEAVHPSLLYFRSPQFKSKVVFGMRGLHSKRITALEWHPQGRHVVTADKAGAVHVWNLGNALDARYLNEEALPDSDRALSYTHHCNINSLAFDQVDPEVMYSTASDGIVCATRLSLMPSKKSTPSREECVTCREKVYNFNPEGWHGQRDFKMAYGMAFDSQLRRCLYVGTNNGTIIRLDPRESSEKALDTNARFHKNKVTCIDVNPIRGDLIATASNDRKLCLWDARKFAPQHALGAYVHGGVVASAFFSPNTGSRVLTTSLDNKIRLWPDVHSFVGDVNKREDAAPTEIVHSHNFLRYLTPFRATWDPKDWRDDLFVCGRFEGDAYYEDGDEGGESKILHPIDLFSAKTGAVVQSLVDSAVALLCTSNKFSPVSDVIATGASRDIILWAPPDPTAKKAEAVSAGRSGGRRRSGEGDDEGESSEEDFDPAERKKRMKATAVVSKRRTRASSRRTVR